MQKLPLYEVNALYLKILMTDNFNDDLLISIQLLFHKKIKIINFVFLNSATMQKQSMQETIAAILKDQKQMLEAHRIITQRLEEDIEAVKNGKSVEETFFHQWIEFIGEDTQNGHDYFSAVTIFHPLIVQTFENFTESMQDALRAGLLNAVIARTNNFKTLEAMGFLIREVIEKDHENQGFGEWIQPIGELIKWMGSEEQGVAQSGVSFFIEFYRETPFTSTNTEIPLHKMAPGMLPALFQIFASAPQQEPKQKPTLRQKILYLLLQIFKTFAYFDGSDDKVINQCLDESFELWISLFVSILKGPVTNHLGMKKYVLKIIIIIYRDLTNFCQKRLPKSSSELITVWDFVYRFFPCYLATQVWGLKTFDNQPINNQGVFHNFDDDFDTTMPIVEVLAHCSVQFISVLVSSSLFSFTVRISMHHIVNTLFHLYIISKNQLKTWSYNNLYFIGIPDYQSLRAKILNVLNQLIQRNNDYAIQSILLIAEKFLINHPQSHTVEMIQKLMESMKVKQIIQSDKLQIVLKQSDFDRLIQISGCDARETLGVRGETWRKSEVALSILGRFSEDIIVFQSKQQGVFDIQSFVRGLMRQFQIQDHNIETFTLKGQSLYCLTRFTEIISIRYKNIFCELVASCSSCTSQVYPTAVRIATCKILTIFLRKIQKHGISLTQQQISLIKKNQTTEGIMGIQSNHQTNSYTLQSLIQIAKVIGHRLLSEQILSLYILDNFHRNISHPATLKLCFSLFQILCSDKQSFRKLLLTQGQGGSYVIPSFITDCLETYSNIVKSEQKKYLKALDTDLIVTVLKIANISIEKCPIQEKQIYEKMVDLVPMLKQIVEHNEDIPIHIASNVCLKSLIRICPKYLKQKGYQSHFIAAIHSLLKIPTDKSFEAASIYVGNLIILTFDCLLEKPDQQILQEVVLKVFRSRTPSVIQSLILTYSKLINASMNPSKPFSSAQWSTKVHNIIDFLASFSIENRMGLKILTDKWLLQQSLFRGKYTKISTFMALSKLFLLRDKRIDNLLVIGFNPSHTNVNNDVYAPLKILATLIRCLHNQMGGDKDNDDNQDNDDQQFEMKNQTEKGLDVGLEKFKDQEVPKEGAGGLADRENQQGSTCYMSAMLQFYDDGEQCDQTTEEDLLFLKDISTKFTLSEYLTDFFLYLNDESCPHHQYFKECLKDLLKEDLKNLQKYIKIKI